MLCTTLNLPPSSAPSSSSVCIALEKQLGLCARTPHVTGRLARPFATIHAAYSGIPHPENKWVVRRGKVHALGLDFAVLEVADQLHPTPARIANQTLVAAAM